MGTLGDDRVTDLDAAQPMKVSIAVRGDHARSGIARYRAANHVSRSGAKLGVVDPFDDNLVDPDAWNEESRNRAPDGGRPAGTGRCRRSGTGD